MASGYDIAALKKPGKSSGKKVQTVDLGKAGAGKAKK